MEIVWQGILSLCVISLAGNVDGRMSIIKGKDAIIADFPHQVSLRNTYFNNWHFCGGSIVSSKHVLTAAHCLESYKDLTEYPIVVVSGTSHLHNKHAQHHKVIKIKLHPDFVNDGWRTRHDIAIITVKHHITFDIHQNKVNLPKHDFKVGDKAVLTGWGMTNQSPEIVPDRLQKLEMELMSTKECQKTVTNIDKAPLYDTELCTVRSHGSGACFGDSGGPLTVNGKLVGIAAWIDSRDCGGKYPDVYTNVFKYIRFIESVINHNEH